MKSTIFITLTILSTLCASCAADLRPNKHSSNNTNDLDRLLEFIRLGPANIFWRDLKALDKKNISSQCLSSLKEVLRSQQEGKHWAFQSKLSYSSI